MVFLCGCGVVDVLDCLFESFGIGDLCECDGVGV